jgi:hypothetical protein
MFVTVIFVQRAVAHVENPCLYFLIERSIILPLLFLRHKYFSCSLFLYDAPFGKTLHEFLGTPVPNFSNVDSSWHHFYQKQICIPPKLLQI